MDACPWCDDDGSACACNDGLPVHRCHANGCDAQDIHPEVPFCKKHWAMLPEPHQKKLWNGRWSAKQCPICWDAEALRRTMEEGLWPGAEEWLMFANMGIALLCYLEYGDHDCPETLRDEQGFCWGCGCHNVPKVYEQAKKIVEKYGLKARS